MLACTRTTCRAYILLIIIHLVRLKGIGLAGCRLSESELLMYARGGKEEESSVKRMMMMWRRIR